MAASAYTDTVQKVYIAYYGRAADPVGLAYWSKAIDDAGGSLDAIMASFGTSAEATTLYGSLSNSAKVNAIYQQSFGRDADFAGLMYYSGQLSAGTMTASSIAQNIFDGATGTDATTLTNKLAVAKAYTTAVDAADEVVAYAGTVAADAARTLLGTVDSTTTVSGFDVDTSIAAMVTAANTTPETAAEKAAAAKVIADAAQVITDAAAAKVITDAAAAVVAANAAAAKVIADAKVLADAASAKAIVDAAAAKVISDAKVVTDAAAKVISDAAAAKVISDAADSTVALTATTDTLTGGSGVNTFTSVLQAAGATGTTVAPGDAISGGAGIDSLTISVAGAAAYTLSAVSTTDVEKVLLSNFDTNTTSFGTEVDGSLMTGVTTVGLSSSSADGDTHFNNMKNLVAAEMNNGSADLKVEYASSVVTGTADAQTLNISNVSGGVFQADATEDITINGSLVKSTLEDVISTTLKSVTVTGDQDLKINAAVNFAATANGTAIDGTIDASALTGGLTALMGGASTVKLTGGTGKDIVDFAGLLTTNDVVDLGDGADTIKMDNAALTTQFTNVSNVETVIFNAAVAAAAMDISKLSAGVTEVSLDTSDATGSGATSFDSTVTNLGSQQVTIKHSVADTATASGDGVQYTLTGVTDTSADSVSIKLDAIGSTASNLGIETLDVANYETINLNSAKSSTVTANLIDAVTASSATSVVITGDAGLTLSALTGSNITSVDASGLAAAFVLTAGSEKATYKMGTKDSTLTMGSNLNASDTIVGGAGTGDTVTATVTGLTAATGALNISDVESVTLDTTGNNTLDLTGVTGATTIEMSDNVQTVTGFDLGSTIHLNGAATASEIDVTATDATGASDTLKVSTAGVTTSIIDASGIETLAVTKNDAGNALTLDLSTFEGSAITLGSKSGITGTAAADFGTLHKNATTVDSTYAGAFDVILSNGLVGATVTAAGTGIQTITGTGFADTITIGTTGAVTHSVPTTGGVDTVNLTAAAALVNVGSLIVENVNVDLAAGVDVTLTTSFSTTVDNAVITGGNSLSTFTTGTIVTDVKSFDASAFLGNVVATVAADAMTNDVTFKGGALATDSLSFEINNAGSYVAQTTGIETLKLNVDATDDVSLTGSVGITRVDVDIASGIDATVTGITTEVIRVTDSAAADAVVATLASNTGSSDSVNFELKGTLADGLQLTTVDVETVNIAIATNAESIDLSTVTMSGTAVASVVTTGDQALTVTALNADVTTVNASGMATGGSFIQTGRSSSDVATYTGSAGNDTFMMLNKGDVLDAGAGTADNLNVDFTGILGGIAVDLTSTTDQIGTMDGATNSVAQVGFESVDLSGYTGFGASITGTKSANILTGTGSIDSISGGAGSDTITGGAGADVINVGTGSNDIVSVASATDSTTAAVVLGTTDISATVDVITGMGDTDRVTFTTASITTASAVALDTAVQVTTGSATADDIGLIRGTYASVTGIFTAGTATSDDDYLVSYLESNASGSDAISHVVLMDIVGTVTSDTLANGIELNV